MAVSVECGHLDGLATLGVDDLQSVACTQEHSGDRAAGHPVTLHAGRQAGHSRHEEPRFLSRCDRHVVLPRRALGAGPVGPDPDHDIEQSV